MRNMNSSGVMGSVMYIIECDHGDYEAHESWVDSIWDSEEASKAREEVLLKRRYPDAVCRRPIRLNHAWLEEKNDIGVQQHNERIAIRAERERVAYETKLKKWNDAWDAAEAAVEGSDDRELVTLVTQRRLDSWSQQSLERMRLRIAEILANGNGINAHAIARITDPAMFEKPS